MTYCGFLKNGLCEITLIIEVQRNICAKLKEITSRYCLHNNHEFPVIGWIDGQTTTKYVIIQYILGSFIYAIY